MVMIAMRNKTLSPIDPLLSLWPNLQPGELTPQLQAEADDAVDGKYWFRFQGVQTVPIGRRDIDWDGGHKAHQEWPVQLNGFRFLPALAAAWCHTRDEKYARAARDYLADWMRARPMRENWAVGVGDTRLTLAIRIGNCRFFGWGGTYFALSDSEAFDKQFREDFLLSIQAQLDFLVDDLTTVGNWRFAQLDTLIASAMRFPQLASAVRWRERGVELMNQAVSEQFLPDGVHIERTPNYHGWMTRILHSYWQLSRARPELGLAISDDLVQRAFEYWMASTRPNGETSRLHDSQSTLPNYPPTELYARFRAEAGLNEAAPTQYFPHAGQALMRNAPGADYVTFDATPYSGSHSHLSINALQVDVKGKPILVDPGILDYERANPMMAYGKSTRAHNTVNFNGWNQAPVTQVQTEYSTAPGYDFVSGIYEGGYWPSEYDWNYKSGLQGGVWGRHQRLMLWAHGRFLLVFDHITYRPDASTSLFTECNWQFERGQIKVDFERNEVCTRNEDANLLLRVLVAPDNMRLHLHEGETDPPRGWTAGEERLGSAPQVVVRGEGSTSNYLKYVTLLVPFEGQSAPEVKAEVVTDTGERVFKIELNGETTYVLLDIAPFPFSREDIRFFGRAGVLRRGAQSSTLWIAAPGKLEADGQSVESLSNID
jgi:hypothetical protein